MTDAQFLSGTYIDWQTISIAAAAISVLFSAMLIILSRALALRNLEQTAKMEFVYATSTVFIVLMVIGIIAVGEPMFMHVARALYLASFNCDYTMNIQLYLDPAHTQPVNSLVDYMKLYMQPPVECAQTVMDALFWASIPVESIASVYIESFMSEPVTGYGIKAIAERIKNATQMLSK